MEHEENLVTTVTTTEEGVMKDGGAGALEEHPGILRVDDVGDDVMALTFDTGKGGPPFVLSPKTLDVIEEVLDRIAGNRDLRGLLIRSAHPSVFCAGADVDLCGRHGVA